MGPRLNSRGDVKYEFFRILEHPASMGPRLNSRGDCRFESCRARHCSASMGPRLNSRGDELIIDPDGPAEPSGLQWGRDLIVAETQLRLWLQGGARAGFNGAAT